MKLAKYGFVTACAVFSLVGSGISAFAAEVGSLDTDAVIQFVPAEDGGAIIDPEDPKTPVDPINPIDPDEEVEPGTSGPLSIDFASVLYFGENKISSQDEVYYVKAQPVKDKKSDEIRYVPNYVQVTDNRGTLEGWTLSVQQNGQFISESGKELTGAAIEFNNGRVNSISESAAPSTLNETFSLDPKGSKDNVVIASEEEGAGTWAYYFGDQSNVSEGESYIENDSITLSVPGSSVKLAETYSTSLTWTLSDVPVNEE